MNRLFVLTPLLCCALVSFAHSAEPIFQLEKGDHICIIGNTLADRLQHDGWFETLLHSRFPRHELVLRNLGYSADEIDPEKRLRSKDFGSPDEWLAGNSRIPHPEKIVHKDAVKENRFELTETKADVIFAFFGYNESWEGVAGLNAFKAKLDRQLRHLLKQQYNGKSAPRIVLFSPTAFENLHDPNLPDGKEHNARLAAYTAVMAEVAKANNVTFVDLFAPTLAYFEKHDGPFTINGIHWTEDGNKALAEIMDRALFGEPPSRNPDELKSLRSAVNDKNWHWFHRYRTTDGYSNFGSRGFLKFTDDQTNYEVLQRESEVLDVMTSNRDKVCWAIAQGKEAKPDDGNAPPFFETKTNKPGSLPDGRYAFLTGEEAIAHMTLGKDVQVNLFASEEQFPELANPVQMAWDTKGRLWVATWRTYPHWKPIVEEMNDKILILEDTDGDGRADKCITFADKLHNPTGFEFYGGGVIVAMIPDILFIKDIDGDDHADMRERILHGLDSADTHHAASSFTLDPGGALYFQEGTFHHTQVETPWGPPRRLANAGVFRFEPRSQKFDVYATYPFANPHGHVFDAWGQDFVTDGTGAETFWGTAFSGRLNFPDKHNGLRTVYQQRTRPCPANEILSSRHFPDDWQGDLIIPNVIGFQGLMRYKIKDDGAGFAADEQEPILFSEDPNFRPADVEMAPDGSLYFTDWQNPIIGHLQHNLRDPNRDKTHGRVYRVTYKDRPLLTPVKLAGEPVEALLDALKQSENRVRYRAKIELSGRKTDNVLAPLQTWTAGLDQNDPNYEHHLLEALWVHQYHNVVNLPLLEKMLAAKDFRARAAAARVLLSWRDRVPTALEKFRQLAGDEHLRVRVEAVRAASFFNQPEAYEILLIANDSLPDYFLNYVTNESARVLEPLVDAAIRDNTPLAFISDLGRRYVLQRTPIDRLITQPRDQLVCMELLGRPGLPDNQRREGLQAWAKLENKPELSILVEALQRIDRLKTQRDESIVFDLVRMLTANDVSQLKTVRAEMEKFAAEGKQDLIRQVGFAMLMAIDETVDPAWDLAIRSPQGLEDLLAAMPIIADPGLRAALYPKVLPLLQAPPERLSSSDNVEECLGRYVRIELPGIRRTLTLAEVEVISGKRNVARDGKAKQHSVYQGGNATRAIDGDKSPRWGDRGQSHTKESQRDPWWEVDLRSVFPISEVRIFNRGEGYSDRLDGFSLSILDDHRREIFRKDNIPSPELNATLTVGPENSSRLLRHAAMTALTTVRGKEAETFRAIAAFVDNDADRSAAIRALQRLPQTAWPPDMVQPLSAAMLGYLKSLPASERTSDTALVAIEFGNALAGLLPSEQASLNRRQFDELGVRIVRVGTLFERMAYDKDVLVVEAGKPVEFVFENNDLMPHNFVITKAGAMEEIGQLAETTALEPGAAERQYVPKSDKILLASKLLLPRTMQKLPFNAPNEPGVYPYVCTYPGHWRRMYGALYVVKNLNEYFANPDSYLASVNFPIVDELLKDRRPRMEWKLSDLASAVEEHSHHGRSYVTGKQMFTMASCVGCHRLENTGKEFGPDLTKLDPNWKPVDVLTHILDPSQKIDDKYKTTVFQMDDGTVVTGMIVEESQDTVKTIENPLTSAEPKVLSKSEIVARQMQNVSPMPKGLLDKLSRDEILDLLAYVVAGGDKNRELFKSDHHHH